MPADETLKAIFGLGILVLVIAFLVPGMISLTSGESSTVYELNENDSVQVTDRLSLTLQDINETDLNVTVELTDLQSLQNTTATLENLSTNELQLEGENITVGVGSVYDADTPVRIDVDYPKMYGWDAGPRTFMQNIEVIVVLIAGIMVMGVVVLLRP